MRLEGRVSPRPLVRGGTEPHRAEEKDGRPLHQRGRVRDAPGPAGQMGRHHVNMTEY